MITKHSLPHRVTTGLVLLAIFAGSLRTNGQFTVSTEPATEIGATTATLRGSVNGRGQVSTCTTCFDWGLTPVYAQRTPPVVHGLWPQPPITWPLLVSARVTGLQPGTTYHYRLRTINNTGPSVPITVLGQDLTFTTPPPPGRPQVITLEATGRQPRSALLNASVNPNGHRTWGWFEWDVDIECDKITEVQDLGTIDGPVALSQSLPRLLPGFTYYYRAVASNSAGVACGESKAVTTLALPRPVIRIFPLSKQVVKIEATSASGELIDIEMTSDLRPPVRWQFATNLRSPGLFQVPVGTGPQLFYRAVMVGNHSPVLQTIGDQIVNEGSTLSFSISAGDPDPEQNLVYCCVTGNPCPSGFTFNPSTGSFGWTPGEEEGPGTYRLTFVATDDVTPPLQHSETITVTVNEVNQGPVLHEIPDRHLRVGESLTFTATATDADLPPQMLMFSLGDPPPGATITPAGLFNWVPTTPGDYTILVKVEDDGGPVFSNVKPFTVSVGPANQPPTVTIEQPAAGSMFLTPTNITVAANASDHDGIVVQVEFYRFQSGLLGGEVKLGEDNSSPYKVVWQDAIPGYYELTARAFDHTGLVSTSAPVTVEIRSVPRLTGSSDPSGNISLQWTFDWRGGLASTSDGYELQESSASATSGFVSVFSSLGANDRQSPRHYAAAARPAGSYWYRVRARKAGAFSGWSQVLQVDVAPSSPPVLRITNDLFGGKDQDGANWGQLNSILRLRIGPDDSSVKGDSQWERLYRWDSTAFLENALEITPGSHRDFDVQAEGPDYHIFIQTGYWDWVHDEWGFVTLHKHFASVLACDGKVHNANKWNVIRISNHQAGTYEIKASDWLPHRHWYGTLFCR